MKRNLIVIAVGLILCLGLTSNTWALDRPWSWVYGPEKEDHTWGGEEGWGSGGGSSTSFGPVTGILWIDLIIVRVVSMEHFDSKDHGITKAQVITGEGGSQSWPEEQPIITRRGE